MEKEILHSNESFNVIKKDGRIGIEPNKLSIVIMPYTSIRGLPAAIGVIEEVNPFREGGKSTTLITGSSNEEDPDVLGTAQRKLKGETGYDVLDPDRWTFLGFLTTGKDSASSLPCFSCDVTSLEPGVPESGASKFSMLSVNDALNTDDCFISSLFVKAFVYGFGLSNSNRDSDDTKTKTESKQVLTDDVKDSVIAVAGVSGVGYTEKDGIVVYASADLADESKKKLDDIFKVFGHLYTVEKIDDKKQKYGEQK